MRFYRARTLSDLMCRHTGVKLQEMLPRLTPLASSLEVLDLSDTKLGGNIPANITVFAKLKTLNMSGMDLEGRSSLSGLGA